MFVLTQVIVGDRDTKVAEFKELVRAFRYYVY